MLLTLARILIILGSLFIITGLILLTLQHFTGIGKLPGDFVFKRGNFTFYFPLATSIVVSVIISILLAVFLQLRR